MNTALIVDGGSLFARSYYAALKDPSLSPVTGGIEISIKTLGSLVNPWGNRLRFVPTHMVIAWDGKAKKDKERGEKTAEYEDCLEQVKRLVPVCLGGSTALPEFEADDACATAADYVERNPEFEGGYVVSGDKDLQQLVSEKIGYFSLNKKSVLSWQSICDDWGISNPRQIALALAILGDSADKISGVKGWGPRKVKTLFESVQREDNLLDIAESLMSGMKPEQIEAFSTSLDLTLLRRDIEGVPPPAPIKIGGETELAQLGLERLWMYLKPMAMEVPDENTEEL